MRQANGTYSKLKDYLVRNKGRFKLTSILFLLLILMVIGFQNREEAVTRVLFFTITMPRFVLLLITALFGFVIGVLFSFHFLGRPAGE